MNERMREQNNTAIKQAMKKVLAYMAKQIVIEKQEESAKISEFMIEDKGIGFKKIPLKMEDLQAILAKMDDMRAEVQNPLEEVDLATVEHPRPIYISSLLPKELKVEMVELLK